MSSKSRKRGRIHYLRTLLCWEINPTPYVAPRRPLGYPFTSRTSADPACSLDPSYHKKGRSELPPFQSRKRGQPPGRGLQATQDGATHTSWKPIRQRRVRCRHDLGRGFDQVADDRPSRVPVDAAGPCGGQPMLGRMSCQWLCLLRDSWAIAIFAFSGASRLALCPYHLGTSHADLLGVSQAKCALITSSSLSPSTPAAP